MPGRFGATRRAGATPAALVDAHALGPGLPVDTPDGVQRNSRERATARASASSLAASPACPRTHSTSVRPMRAS